MKIKNYLKKYWIFSPLVTIFLLLRVFEWNWKNEHPRNIKEIQWDSKIVSQKDIISNEASTLGIKKKKEEDEAG